MNNKIKVDLKKHTVICSDKVKFTSIDSGTGCMWYTFKIKEKGDHAISIFHPYGNDHYVIEVV